MLGKYERLDVLGHGASGIVYLAKDTLLGKQVALKEISAQGEEKERFLEEARVLDRLRHPNIVQVNSVDEIGGRIVIDMEYVRGRNLQEVLRETPTLPISQAVSIAAQICDGLAYAHSQRTVHRDIKPANILLTRDGSVKLVDFGLAEVLGTHSFAGGAGTYAYMAPEDFHPEEQSDRQSDIWAVGVILYEMLAGRRPFQAAKAKDPFAWKTAIESDPLPPVSTLRPDTPPELDAIVVHALARAKAERYRDAGVMASDLRKLFPAAEPLDPDWVVVSEPPERSRPFRPAPLALPGFPADLADIDTFLALAPDRWEAAREVLVNGSLGRWLRGLEEEPLAAVADEAAAEPGRDDDDKLRDFLYRAGLETTEEARRAYEEAQPLLSAGRRPEAAAFLSRAVRLDPSRPEYVRDLAVARSEASHQLVVSREAADFGTMRRGQSRTQKIVLQNSDGGALEGRVSAAPGWLRVEPPAFSTRRRQTLTLTTVTEAVWSAPAVYQDTVTLETSSGRREIAVSVRILPARLSWSRIAFWYGPLLVCAGLPAGAALLARLLHPPVSGIQQPGFAAAGLLFLSAFVLAFAADVAWPPRLLPLGLAGFVFWRLSFMLGGHAVSQKAQGLLLQTATPIVILLILQTCAVIFDAPGWGNWKIWGWIVAAVGLLAGYGLLHFG